MCMCIYVCVCVYMCNVFCAMCVYVCSVCAMCVHVYVYMCMYVCMCMCVCVCNVCVCMCVYVCMYVCMYVWNYRGVWRRLLQLTVLLQSFLTVLPYMTLPQGGLAFRASPPAVPAPMHFFALYAAAPRPRPSPLALHPCTCTRGFVPPFPPPPSSGFPRPAAKVFRQRCSDYAAA